MNRDFVIGGLNIKELFRHLNGVQNSTRGKPMKYYLVFVQENGNVREVQENIEVDYATYIEIFEKVRE